MRLIVALSVLALFAGCGMPADGRDTSGPEAAPLMPSAEPSASPAAGDGESLVDAEELIGLGEIGLLPSLLQTLSPGIDCDFDDAYSTCQ